MLLPLVLALVTALPLALVIGPLMRATRATPERLEFDRAVYRDQLSELVRDRNRGLIGPAEEEAARREIERRMLAADRADRAPPRESRPVPYVAVALALVLAAGAGALYDWIGAPGVPDDPYASRRAAAPRTAGTDLAATDAALQKQLAAKPDDVEGWAKLGRDEAELRNWDTSADAYRHAVTLAPARADLGAAYGEVLIFQAGGIVTPAAEAAFKAVLAHDPASGIARYYLALADAQAGRTSKAIAQWQKLAAEAPANAPIRAQLQQRIADAAKAAGIKPPPLAAPAAAAASAAAPGPTQQQMEDAAKMSPEARQAMIRTMVKRLAGEMKSQPNDLAGWTRLARAYAVLGERDQAADAFEHAATLDPKDPALPLGAARALLAGKPVGTVIDAREQDLLHKVEALKPGDPEALWYLGLAAAQAKKPGEAERYWQRLLAALPADAGERKTVTDAIAALKGK
jgi:cytochrome c-type biogenesis protein CcmH